MEALERSHSNTPSSNHQHTAANVPEVSGDSISTQEWLRDMHLFHHYVSTDGLWLARERRQEDLWRTVIPDLAFTHVRPKYNAARPYLTQKVQDALMHGLLALSGLHVSKPAAQITKKDTLTCNELP